MNNGTDATPARSSRGLNILILSFVLIGSLLLSACDLGGSSPTPSSGAQNPPANTAAPGNSSGNSGSIDFNGGGATAGTGGNSTGGTTGGTSSGSGGNGIGTGATAPPVAISGKMAAMIPINGTDPSQQPIVQMVQRVGPGVVTVVNSLNPSVTGGQAAEARGSGAIIDQQGHIVTNNHVVEGEQQLVVIFADGKKQQAKLIGADPDHDLALLQVSGQMPAVIPIGNSDQLLPGEVVVAIGSALGEFVNTVTVGVVSGLHRNLDEGNGVTIQNLIQTDAAINHGNSGGPLLNLNGELIGINTLGVTSAGQGDIAQGLGFAIPASSVTSVVSAIMKSGGNGGNPGAVASTRPYLGVTIVPVTPQIASYYNLTDPNGQLLQQGALVEQVAAGSPAQQAGLQPGDVIVALDNNQVTADTPLGDILTQYQAGQQVTLTIIRQGRQGTTKLTLGTRPPGQ